MTFSRAATAMWLSSASGLTSFVLLARVFLVSDVPNPRTPYLLGAAFTAILAVLLYRYSARNRSNN